MLISQDKILQEDIENIVSSSMLKWDKFKDTRILITGATGLLGSQIVRTLMLANEIRDLNLKVFALVRSKEKAEKVFSEIDKNDNLNFIVQDIQDKLDIQESIDYIIHGASMTSSKSFVEQPVETIYTSIEGCNNIFEFAKNTACKGCVYLSSMEVYGITQKKEIMEEDLGYLNPLTPRSSYSEGKRMCECLAVSYMSEYQVPIKVIRLTQTFGPGVSKEDNRVFAQFAKCTLEKSDIILHTKGETTRNYCYTKDAITAILLVLLDGKEGEAYNVANEETAISIYDMAKMLVDRYANGEFEVKIQLEDESKHGYNPVNRTCISSKKINGLGWQPSVGLEEAFERMIQSMKDTD
ncbi:NAD-dependent epimerase/dehydratase family protein [Anaerosacchariphilus polymeriproducens]|uniref:NAD(P)-dependent oxidoreductase n=1 Tax=Anaerosacchariphilus polymeriproducens TaxID=1812858 RepID=A0A371ARB3_9FIRM|nr:NAD(P)-dependent oxidoreductase [Anaerosacchariphilus polymeriproducens]RDU22115.1 NAD(P)-dependent oxidoreductase [Anaerosacchariphilus polymeriproducens]